MSAFLFYQGGKNICGIINEIESMEPIGVEARSNHGISINSISSAKILTNVTISNDNSKFTLQESKNAMSGEQNWRRKCLCIFNIFRIFVVGLRREISGERRFNDERLMGRGRKPSLDMWKRMMVRNIPSYILSVEARIKSRQSSAWPWGGTKWNTPATKGGSAFRLSCCIFLG